MENDELQVTISRAGASLCGRLRIGEDTGSAGGGYSLELEVDGLRFRSVEDDLFECLLTVRRQLEAVGLQVHVNGASVDVWPSSMAKSMCGGRKAYKMTMGKQALMADLVDIFELAPNARPGAVAEQLAFRKDWFNSLG